MPSNPTMSELSSALPGRWTVRATNLELWLDGQRVDPLISFELVERGTLTLATQVEFTTTEGKRKTVLGQSRLKRDGFLWRGRGILMPFISKWSVIGSSDDQTILVVRYRKTRAVSSGIDVLVREDSEAQEVRTIIAQRSEDFGLSLEDFASLNWMPQPVES